MKKNQHLLFLICTVLTMGCSQVEDVKDALDLPDCINKLYRLEENADDLSCSELINEFKSIQKSCGALDEDGSIQEAIELLESTNCGYGN